MTLQLRFLAVAAAVLTVPVLGGAPSAAAGLFWEVRWSAPVTTAGPNTFAAPPELRGDASPPVAGNPTKVSYSVNVPDGYPAACADPGGPAALAGRSFTIKPLLRCNGSYRVTVVASANAVPQTSPELEAPISLADPGPAPVGLHGSVVDRRVTISWARDEDPDVVGYRIRRDGRAIADVGAEAGAFTDAVAAPGRYAYEVQGLRWGAGGPGSPAIASPPSPPLSAPVVDGAPPAALGPAGPGAGAGTGGPATSPGSASAPVDTAAAGALPPARSAAPKAPAARPAGSRSRYRSGGTITPRSGSARAEEPDTYQETLPYTSRTARRAGEVAEPDTARTFARTVSTPHATSPGLWVPFAVVVVLLAGSIQIAAFLRRTARAGVPIPVEPLDT